MTDLKLAVTRGDAPMLYLTSIGSYTVRFHLRLDERIRKDAMRIALDRTAERYPYFCVSVKKSDKEIYYAENRAPAALLHSSEPPVLNTAQTNGHIWAVSYEDDNLYVDFYHGRADGAGIYPLLATLLYYYYRERDGLSDDSGIRTLEKAVTVAETRDPVDDLPLIDLSAFKLPPAVPALNVMREKNLSRSGNKGFTHRISIPMESFIPFIKDNDATPGLMVCILFARAIERVLPGHTDPIVGSYVVNARPMLHSAESFHNCTSRVVLHYDESVSKMPLEKQGTVFRGKTMLQSDEDAVRKVMTVVGTRAKAILDSPDLQTKILIARDTLMRAFQGASYMVSYVGKWQYRQLEDHIRELWTYTPAGLFPMIEVSSVNGRVFLAIMQPFEEDVYYDAFIEDLRDHKISFIDLGKEPISLSDIVYQT